MARKPRKPRELTGKERTLFASVDVKGDKELMDAIDQAAGQVSTEEVVNILMDSARAIRDRAKALAPVKTGLLRRSIFADEGRPWEDRRGVSVLLGVSVKAPHRHLVEFGHAGPNPAPPHPFWRPAIIAEWPIQRASIMRRVREMVRGKYGV